jgi:hypothetical protein
MLARNPTAASFSLPSPPPGVVFHPPLAAPVSPPPLGSDPTFPQATTAALFPAATHDALDLAGMLTPRELAVRDRAREFMVRRLPAASHLLASPSPSLLAGAAAAAARGGERASLAPPPQLRKRRKQPPAPRPPKPANPPPPPNPPHHHQQVKEVAPIIAPYWEKAAFPFELLPKLRALDLGGANLPPEHGGQGLSVMECAMACFEMARVDASVATFYLVHNYLALLTVGMLGSDDHRRELVPKMRRLEAVGAWALTESARGSDAAAVETTATPLPGGAGYRLEGTKRWIGNSPFADVIVVWARNTQTNSVNAFIVRKGAAGLSVGKMENKTALRCVQNGDISLRGVVVPESDRLPGVSGFGDTNKVLAVSRVMVTWLPVGEWGRVLCAW